MERELNMDEISDGKRYGLNDLVRVGCEDCAGCSSCCQGMEDTIVLDPLDIFRLTQGLGKSFEELLGEAFTLGMVDSLALPRLKMEGEEGRCVFLNKEGRCRIHSFRPGICRLFPLGRIYEEQSFWYFLQVHECVKKNKTKIKVKKWIDTPEPGKYEDFVLKWHNLVVRAREKAERMDGGESQRQMLLGILRVFYQISYAGDRDFYIQFEERLKEAELLV